MATVKPFRAIRPTGDKVHLVASRSYITYNKKDLNAKLSSNPYSFIHIINPEFGVEKTAKANSKELFLKIKDRFDEFMDEGIFEQDDRPYYYIYEQEKKGRKICGIIALASTIDYGKGKIKKHEQTLSKREAIFCDYLKTCDIHAEPVLLSYPDHSELSALIEAKKLERPYYDFSTTNKVRHRLWIIEDEQKIDSILKYFGEIESLYIADGHHRSASSYLLSQNMGLKDDHPYNYFMSYLIPESELQIFPFNRLIKDIGQLSVSEFLEKIKQNFDVEEVDHDYTPAQKGILSLYIDNKNYALTRKDKDEDLDTEILNNKILDPILGIVDLRNDKRVNFVGGEDAYDNMIKEVRSGKYVAAFGLYPVSVQDLKRIADNDETMPPKSTWIEPKLRSGLTIYSYGK